MSEHPYQFAVLRYTHDPMTQEFLNVGVVVYSRQAGYLRARFSRRYKRLSKAFLDVDGEMYRRMAEHLERRLDQFEERYLASDMFEDRPEQLEDLLQQALPIDDSGLAFGGYGAGLAPDLDEALASLYDRLVEKYVDRSDLASRTDEEIWQVYREQLDRVAVTTKLSSKVVIHTPTYEYEFCRAWKNERWHAIEPISLDLVHGRNILEKANTWIGRAVMLAESEEIGTLYLLVGGPRDEELQSDYRKALRNMREKLVLDHEIIEEEDAARFSSELAAMIDSHSETKC